MKKAISLAIVLFLFSATAVPAYAEDEGKRVLVDWHYYKDETRDESFFDRLYYQGREIILEDSGTVPKPPGYIEPTPEELEANKAREEEYKREQNEFAWENSVYYEKEQRDAMMGLVFQDYLSEVNIPEDSFNGDYGEYKNKDGSVTKVYDNGSVSTKYADGSVEAFDTWGNHYVQDKDGNQTVRLTDGNTLTSDSSRDSYTWHGRDGSSFIPNDDGSVTWKNSSGIVIEYNAEGERTAIGFEHGEKMELRDGMFPQGDGSLKGPDGAVIEWHNGSAFLGDGIYSFRVIGEDGRGGQANCDPNYDYRVDEEATREKKLETNGEYKGFIMNSDTKIEISSFNGNAWEIVSSNYYDDEGSVSFENWDGDVYTDKYFRDGGFRKTYSSADGTKSYEVTLDDNGLNAFYKDKEGEHNLINTSVDDNGNVVLNYNDGGKLVINDETGVSEYTGTDGTRIITTTDGDDQTTEYSNPKTGVSYTEKNGVIISGTGPIGDGLTLNVNNGEMEIVTRNGEKIKVTEYSDGSLSAELPDGSELTKEPDGGWLKDGEPLREPDEEGENEQPQGAPEFADLSGYYSGSVKVHKLNISEEAFRKFKESVSEGVDLDSFGKVDLGEDVQNMTQAQCDEALNSMVAEGGFGAVGELTIASGDASSGACTLTFTFFEKDEEEYEENSVPITATYADGEIALQAPSSGKLSAVVTDDGIKISGSNIKLAVSADGMIVYYVTLSVDVSR